MRRSSNCDAAQHSLVCTNICHSIAAGAISEGATSAIASRSARGAPSRSRPPSVEGGVCGTPLLSRCIGVRITCVRVCDELRSTTCGDHAVGARGDGDGTGEPCANAALGFRGVRSDVTMGDGTGWGDERREFCAAQIAKSART